MKRRTQTDRTGRVDIRCSEAERQAWMEKSAAGQPLSALIHNFLNGLPTPKSRKNISSTGCSASDPALLKELSAQGNNLNQLARYANIYANEADAQAILIALEAIRAELEEITNRVEGKKKTAPQGQGGKSC